VGDEGIKVGEMPFVDAKGQNRPISIYIYISARFDGFGGGYNPEKHLAFIDYEMLKDGVNVDELHHTYAHKIGHGLDPRLHPGSGFRDSRRNHQMWQRYAKNHADVEDKRKQAKLAGLDPYSIAGPDSRIHYLTPKEFEAIGTELSQFVIDYFNGLKQNDRRDLVEEMEW
jgi:hypothetical protein